MTGTAAIDPDLLLRPMIELLAGVGTGVLGTVDPGAALRHSGGLVDAAVITSAGALAAVGRTWSGAAAEQAHQNGAHAERAGHEVGRRGKDLGAVLQTAAGIVAQGNAELAGIAQSFAGVAAAAAPVALTPPGQAMLITAAAEHLGRALAVVARTRTSLDAQTAQLDLLAAPIPLPTAPQVQQALGLAAQLASGVGTPLANGAADLIGSAPNRVASLIDSVDGVDPSGRPFDPAIGTAPRDSLELSGATTPTAAVIDGAGSRLPPDLGRAVPGHAGSGWFGSGGVGSGGAGFGGLAGAPLPAGATSPAPASTPAGATPVGSTRAGLATTGTGLAPTGRHGPDDERRATPSVLAHAGDRTALVGDLGQVVIPVIGADPAPRG